jgi:hypothetical protein
MNTLKSNRTKKGQKSQVKSHNVPPVPARLRKPKAATVRRRKPLGIRPDEDVLRDFLANLWFDKPFHKLTCEELQRLREELLGE